MSVQTSSVERNVSTAKATRKVPSTEMNPADAHPPSRPGTITTIVFLTALGALLLYMNWKSAKGFFGME